jgi:hypothetical protein
MAPGFCLLTVQMVELLLDAEYLVTLSGYAAWPNVADTVIEVIHRLCQQEDSQGFR